MSKNLPMIFQKELIRSLNTGGETVAIQSGEKRITYSKLLDTSNRITHFLLGKNIGRETTIGILLEERLDIIYSIIGVANARCVFVPIDSSLPKSRLKSIFSELSLEHVITSESLAPKSIEISNQYFLKNILDASFKGPVNYPEYKEDDSLYVYFTSGSTGIPKGIIGKNCSLLQFLRWEIDTFEIDNSFKVSQFISPYFDAFLRDVFVPLLSGATLCVPPTEGDVLSAQKMRSWIEDFGISLIHCVPSLFRVLKDDLAPNTFPTLRFILLSGEKIIPSELTDWYEIFEDRIQLVNLYGTTETTMIRSYYEIQPEDAHKSRMPIGKPISDTELVVVNKDLKPTGTLITGELLILSEYMTKGYLNNPELTAKKFITLNKGTTSEKRAFRTGDRARTLPSGNVELLGREDRQIKLRGIRIELDEVENLLSASELIKNIVVIPYSELFKELSGAETPREDKSLVAFVIAKESKDNNTTFLEDLEKHAKKHMPGYMVPDRFVKVDIFPLLPNGKINYAGLLNKLTETLKKVVPPSDETEKKLLSVWKGILGTDVISTEDSFNKIGGNSLNIMRLISRIYTEFEVRMPLKEFFNRSTIKTQADYIRQSSRDNSFKISKTPLKPSYPLSSAQERMFFNYDLDRESTAYNLPVAFASNKPIDVEKVQEIFRELVQRHEVLRTVYRVENEEIRQVILDTIDFSIERVNGQDITSTLLNFVQPFNLSDGPVFRLGITNDKNGRNVLIFDIHHIACDGMSQITLFTEFLMLFNNQKLAPLEIQYKDYAAWEWNFKKTEDYQSQRKFWLNAFKSEVPSLEFPSVNNLLGHENSLEGGKVVLEINNETIQPLIDNLKNENITNFSVICSIYFVFLSQLTGQEDIVVGIASAGRFQKETEELLGMFSKTLPIRQKLDLSLTFKVLVRNIAAYWIEASSKQAYDLTDTLIELNKTREDQVKSLFDVMLVYQNFDQTKLSSQSSDFMYQEFDYPTVKYPLSLFVNEGGTSFNFTLEYASVFFSNEDASMLMEQLKELIFTISQNPDVGITQLIEGNTESFESIEGDFSIKL